MGRKFLLIFIFLIFILLELNSISKESLTWDETGHFTEGIEAITNNNFTISPNSPTFIPQLLVFPNIIFSSDKPIVARFSVLLFTILFGIAIYNFCLLYFNQNIALLSLIFFLFEPTVFSHARYITLDMGFSLFYFLSFWSCLEFIKKPDNKRTVIAGFIAGLAVSAKVTGLGFILIAFLLLFIKFRKKNRYNLLLFGLLFLFGIWFTYRFTLGNLGEYTENSNRLSNKIAVKISEVNPQYAEIFKKSLSFPVPLGDFPRIVKNAYVFNLNPKTSFFLGSVRQTSFLWFIVLYFLKTPIPLIVFCLFAGSLTRKIHLLIIPMISIILIVFFSKMDLRLRYLLPLYPYVSILAGIGFFQAKLKISKITQILLLLWFFIGFWRVYPYTLAYANEVSVFFGKPYEIFSDSNIDWGQGLIALKGYAEKNQIGKINLSYYGSDDPNLYGFTGFLKNNLCKKTCVIDQTVYSKYSDKIITAISITNWQECGFSKQPQYNTSKVKEIVGGSLLIFD